MVLSPLKATYQGYNHHFYRPTFWMFNKSWCQTAFYIEKKFVSYSLTKVPSNISLKSDEGSGLKMNLGPILLCYILQRESYLGTSVESTLSNWLSSSIWEKWIEVCWTERPGYEKSFQESLYLSQTHSISAGSLPLCLQNLFVIKDPIVILLKI